MIEAPREITVRLTLTSRQILAIRKLGGELAKRLNFAIHEAMGPAIVSTNHYLLVRDAVRLYGRFDRYDPDGYAKATDLLHCVQAWLEEVPVEAPKTGFSPRSPEAFGGRPHGASHDGRYYVDRCSDR